MAGETRVAGRRLVSARTNSVEYRVDQEVEVYDSLYLFDYPRAAHCITTLSRYPCNTRIHLRMCRLTTYRAASHCCILLISHEPSLICLFLFLLGVFF